MECYSNVLGNLFAIFKNILKLIQIIGPIIMIVFLTINLFTLVKNPEEKKVPKKIRNSFIALVLLFVLPIIVNAVITLILGNSNAGLCYKNAELNFDTPTYKPISDSNNKNDIDNYDDYKNVIDNYDDYERRKHLERKL